MGLFKELKSALNGGEWKKSNPAAPLGAAPTARSMYQSRQNFGVNFGSLFVLEKYIFDSFFIDDTSVELDAVNALVKRDGIEKTREKFEQHWISYCEEDEWKWLKDNGVQSIRIPIGYWILGGSFTKGTSFEKVSDVYKNGWEIFKTFYVDKAKEHNISILVDLHALPKGANTGDHSGEWFKEAGFWNSDKSIDLAVDLCRYIADDLKAYENISGIQIVNESIFEEHPKGQLKYYNKTLSAIREVNGDIPVVISDGWWSNQWIDILNQKSKGELGSLGVVIDSHVYRCFSDDDKAKNVDQILNDLPNSVLNGLSCEADFIVGEFSCVLDKQTWDKSQNTDREEKVKEYGQLQYKVMNDRARTGCYFWTFKFEHGDGGEWGFRPMIEKGCIPKRETSSIVPSQQTFDQLFGQYFQNHQNYWTSQNQNEKYEFWRYQEGFITGWNDALNFAKFDNSRIGRLTSWKYARMKEHVSARGSSKHIWQWCAGFDEALNAFNSL